MEAAIILVFVLGYLAITMEHSIKIDKLIPALVMMAICWALVALGLDLFPNWFDSSTHTLIDAFSSFPLEEKKHLMEETLLHHLGKTAEILVFLLGAMTIVEIIDYFDGFSTIKGFITTKKKTKILWIFSILAFILSAIIDNLTATIVLISILQKIVKDKEVRLYYAGLIIIAANAGGAWSPIGDVTTTMLWIGNKVTTGHLVGYLFVPSLMCMAVPTFIASFLPVFKGELQSDEGVDPKPSRLSSIMLYLGLGAIVFVPIFKTVTHLPPYVGMMLSLAIVAVFAEIYSKSKFSITDIDHAESESEAHHSPVHHSLSKIELPSILFFLGILMAVAALESLGILFGFAGGLQEIMPMIGTEIHDGEGVSDLVVLLLGAGSAVIDNVPLVAASLGMFHEATDNELWHFIAFAAGTGGSMLVIGSAAGVVAMGMEKIDFFWYLKKMSWLALIGFLVGSAVFMVTRTLF
ncbi:sodium:proton antiporter NhaD [Pseudotamlana carrageenivorans]|uniref:Sodium:proton antiporter n=1 Tax=Pseudotamlana carrageenivorans TaxID=2069432 RepID=A0A2I7SI08_9FLAO|nr:sodium:proton antiporter NhaD [Tamlana carrageenivorans]AUS05555.1 sodium:proton antiporter [Tamlana carrageenivorans]